MQLNNRIQAAKIGYIMISILLCVLGIVLIAMPDFSVMLLCRLGGGIMVLFGLVKIVGYCSKDLYRLAFQFDLAFGILLVALGVILIIRTDAMVNLICIVMGICVLADALLKIQISIDSKAFGIQKWWLILAVAILTGAAGFLLVLRPSESAQVVMILLGVTLITEGVLNMITILTAVKIIRHQLPEVIDAEYCEIEQEPEQKGCVITNAFFKGGCKIPHTDLNSNRFADDSGSDWHCKYQNQL